MTDLPHNFHSEWRECQSQTDPEMSAVRGEYLVADNLPIENAITIASAPDALRALHDCVAAWDALFILFPVSEAIENAEFKEFARARSVLAQATRKDA